MNDYYLERSHAQDVWHLYDCNTVSGTQGIEPMATLYLPSIGDIPMTLIDNMAQALGAAYDNGWRAGYRVGYEVGHDSGCDDGYTDGYDHGMMDAIRSDPYNS